MALAWVGNGVGVWVGGSVIDVLPGRLVMGGWMNGWDGIL